MTEPVYGLSASAAKILQEMADRHRQRLPDVGRRTRRLAGFSDASAIKVLGPCESYVPAIELADSSFNVDFGGGCDGPSRYGLIAKNLDTNATSTINLEHVGGLVYESASFSWNCAGSTITLTADLDFSGLEIDDALLTIYESATPIATYINSIYRFFPLVGSYLQVQTSPCDCVTLPYDVCIAPPTR